MKKRLMLFTLLLVLLKTAQAQSKIIVSVTNFENSKGICRGCLFTNAEAFSGKGAPLKCTQVSVSGKTAQLVFENVPEGVYAVSVFHDVNSNNKMDKNFLGIPKEGYGASKNKLPFASAPTFNENKFNIANQTITSLTIKLRNL